MFRVHVVWAVFKRNVLSYFSGLIGYLFIIAFVLGASYFAFEQEFFTDNIPSLDHLTAIFPWLLLFIVPAITMSTWSDERRTGTDELLFTLPGNDSEILLGKYFSVVAIYTVALVFSMTQLLILSWLGEPDWGVVATTYFGYWIAGCSLLSAGMLASSLTSSTPVAFVLGIAFCLVPIGLYNVVDTSSETLRQLTVAYHLRDFSVGLVPLESLLYFATFAALMLYLNMVVITRRHWTANRKKDMPAQFGLRTICLAAVLGSLTYIAGQKFAPADFTAEKLYTLSTTTTDLIDRIRQDERNVEIQAFISPVVPQQYLETRKSLIGILDRLDQLGGDMVSIRRVDVEPFDPSSEEAANLGIQSVALPQEIDGRIETVDVYLGAVVTSSYDEVVIPFFGKGLPIEYELARAIGTVSKEKRLKVGILQTDAQVVQEDESLRSREWQLTTALRANYDVSAVNPDEEIPLDQFDVLLAVMPSSLTAPQMSNLIDYVRSSAPILIFDDPLPYFMQRRLANGMPGVTMAPRLAKPSPGGGMGGMFGMNQQQAPPKADEGRLTSLLDVLQVYWPHDEIVWDSFNPHLEFNIAGEFVFISPASGVDSAINSDSAITRGMQELLAAYAGSVHTRKTMNRDRVFEPLLRTSVDGVLVDWESFTAQSFDMMSMSPAAGLRPIDNATLTMFHTELKFESAPRQLKLTILRADGETPIAVPEKAVKLTLEGGGDESLALTAVPADDEPKGFASVYVLKGDKLPASATGIGNLRGAIEVRVGPDDYRGKISPIEANDHGPNKGSLVSMTNSASHVIAARIFEEGAVNAVFVADIDMISDWFFQEREQQNIPLVFDNVSFVMNAIDVLAGDETFVDLRTRRAKLRTLTHLQRQRDEFIQKRNAEERRAEAEAANQLKAARKRFEDERKRIEQDDSLDQRSKEQLLANIAESEQRRVEVSQAIIDRETQQEIKQIEQRKSRSIRRVEERARWTALLVSLLPASILGLTMMLWLTISERRTVTPERSVR